MTDAKRKSWTDLEKCTIKNSNYNFLQFFCFFRFGSGFGADARRKRHTADSGYGSEQPLDRRWSQEFGHEVSRTFYALVKRPYG